MPTAAACLLFCRWRRTRSPGQLALMLLLTVLAFWVRPLTAACVGVTLVSSEIWKLRAQPAQLSRFVAAIHHSRILA